jgi:hypothetical protein
MTNRQLKKAAKLWALSSVAHAQMDTGVADFDRLRKVAIDDAWNKLKSLGFDPGCMSTEQDCINAIVIKMI